MANKPRDFESHFVADPAFTAVLPTPQQDGFGQAVESLARRAMEAGKVWKIGQGKIAGAQVYVFSAGVRVRTPKVRS